MDTKRLQLNFFITLLVGVIILTFLLFKPFIAPIALAFMAAIVVRPIDNWFLKVLKGRRTLAAVATLIFVLLVIFVPLIILVQQVVVETINFYFDVREGGLGGFDRLTWYIISPIQKIFPDFDLDLQGYVSGIANSFLSNARNIFESTASLALGTFIAIASLFYMLRDGHSFRKTISDISPLSDEYDNEIMNKIERAVNSVVRGSLFTSLIKGILAAVGFLIFGVPHPILWGTLTAIVSLLPAVGAGLTLVPAIIYLVAINHLGMALGLALWGFIVVGLVDNILMPIVVGKGFTVHPILVLLSVLGGIAFFGPVGLFLGPLVIALFSALIEIYKLLILDDKDKETTTI
jgi:predicted PurR-regulated permease PerM